MGTDLATQTRANRRSGSPPASSETQKIATTATPMPDQENSVTSGSTEVTAISTTTAMEPLPGRKVPWVRVPTVRRTRDGTVGFLPAVRRADGYGIAIARLELRYRQKLKLSGKRGPNYRSADSWHRRKACCDGDQQLGRPVRPGPRMRFRSLRPAGRSAARWLFRLPRFMAQWRSRPEHTVPQRRGRSSSHCRTATRFRATHFRRAGWTVTRRP